MLKQWMTHVKYKKLLLFIVVLFITGLLFGIVYYLRQDEMIRKTLINSIVNLENDLTNTRVNNIFIHLLVSFCVIILSFTIIGIPIIYFYLFFEGLSIGFSFSIIVNVFGIKGIIFSLLYFIFYKFLFLILLFYLLSRSSRISKNMLGFLFYKNSKDLKNNILINVRKVIVFLIFILINDIAIYFYSSFLNKVLIFFL